MKKNSALLTCCIAAALAGASLVRAEDKVDPIDPTVRDGKPDRTLLMPEKKKKHRHARKKKARFQSLPRQLKNGKPPAER